MNGGGVMGKASKKLIKNQQKNKADNLRREVVSLKDKMLTAVEEERYEDALETMAELAGDKCMDPEVMYNGAVCYFMTGDYERTAKWLDNTLRYAPDHVQARVLLARLCILEERTEDGLAIFDFVLENWADNLADDVQEEIEEILEYYARNEADKLRRRYPHIAAFMKLEEGTAGAAAAPQEAAAAPLQKAQAAVEALKKLMAKTETSHETAAAEPVLPAETEQAASTAGAAAKAQSAVAALKNLMAKTEIKETGEKISNAAEAKLAQTQEALRKLMPKEEPADAVPQQARDILQQSISVVEKIRLLNAKAGEAFAANHLAEAQSLLQAALELDSCEDATLRNLALTAIAGGNRKQAIAYALRMTTADFLLLDRLRVH